MRVITGYSYSANKEIDMSSGNSNSSDWKETKDGRYEEKIRENNDGTYTRVTRRTGQETNYPHWTENYDRDEKRTDGRYDSHYSPSNRGTRTPSHKNGGSTLDDLGID